MRPVYAKLLYIVGVLGFGTAAWGQTATLRLISVDPPNAIIAPDETVTLEVTIETVPRPLRGYQTALVITPEAGTTGSLDLADPTPTGPNDALYVNKGRSDFVFYGLDSFVSWNVESLLLGAALVYGADSVDVTTPKYCGTYIFRASSDALGEFQINFTDPNVPNPNTFLRGAGGATDPILPVDVFGTTVTVTLGPPNDNCTSATEITEGVPTEFSTESGTVDGPELPSWCDEGGGTEFGPDVWFEYTATCSGPLVISTCDPDGFDTRLAVYSDGSMNCTCPTDNTNLLDCSDDAAGCSLTSEVVLAATEGVCYTIRVGSPDALITGTGDLTVVCIANDDCDNALPVTPGPPEAPTTISGSTDDTNVDDSAPSPCGPPIVAPGVWYSVTASDGGHAMTASLCQGASFDTRLTVYEGAICDTLTCVAGVDNTCGNQEELSWCTTADTKYWILVHGGSPGLTGSFTLQVWEDDCDDSSVCTDDSCNGGECQYEPNYDEGVYCCDPVTGDLCEIDDGNPCTDDWCNPVTGACEHDPVPDGPNPACADIDSCTLDECIDGDCANTDINTIPCTDNSNCPEDYPCDQDAGFCVCVPSPSLTIVVEPGSLPVSSCFGVGDLITVHLDMSYSPTPIVTGQFFLEYDSSTLLFVDMAPGNTFDPSSPFTFQMAEIVDPVAGTIGYLVGVPPLSPGTVEPATMAVATFQVQSQPPPDCETFVRYQPDVPTRLLNEDGFVYDEDSGNLILVEPPPLIINATPPIMTACPGDIEVAADPGEVTAVVTWETPTATDDCDGSIPVVCDPPSGWAFPGGITTVTCTATNSCGVEDQCTFSVDVEASTLTVDIQLSPPMATGQMIRCITFELHDCVGGTQVTISQSMIFTNGEALGVVVPIPAGTWDCVTARDKVHTLRSTANNLTTSDGVHYTATFTGNPGAGGHWLVGGDLDDSGWIEILDYAVFLQQYLQPVGTNSGCHTPPPHHADISGNGVVHVEDLSHIQTAMFKFDEPNCCGLGGSAGGRVPVTEISVHELYLRGEGYLRYGDMNNDGKLDSSDVALFIEVYSQLEPAGPTHIEVPAAVDEGPAPAKQLNRRIPRR